MGRPSTACSSPACETGAAVEVVLDGILGDWDAYFERKRREAEAAPKGEKPGKPEYRKEDDVIGKLVAAWARQPAAVEYLKGLPPDVQASGTITRGLLLAHLVRSPDSATVLQEAWKNALASPFAPDLLALVLQPPAGHHPGRIAGAAAD